MPYIAPEVVHFSGNTYTTRRHDSLKISNLKISNGKWMWWSQSIGGRSTLDYLIKIRGYSFMEAIEIIAGQAAIQPLVSVSAERKTEKMLLLPKPYRYTEYVVSYLKNRGIDMELIDFCLKTGRMLSLAGGYRPAKKIEESKIPSTLVRFLKEYPHVQTIVFHLDNDRVGILATKAIQTVLPEQYETKDKPR